MINKITPQISQYRMNRFIIVRNANIDEVINILADIPRDQ